MYTYAVRPQPPIVSPVRADRRTDRRCDYYRAPAFFNAGALINTFIPAQAKNLIFSLYTVFQIQMMACWKKKIFFSIKIVKQSLNA